MLSFGAIHVIFRNLNKKSSIKWKQLLGITSLIFPIELVGHPKILERDFGYCCIKSFDWVFGLEDGQLAHNFFTAPWHKVIRAAEAIASSLLSRSPGWEPAPLDCTWQNKCNTCVFYCSFSFTAGNVERKWIENFSQEKEKYAQLELMQPKISYPHVFMQNSYALVLKAVKTQ